MVQYVWKEFPLILVIAFGNNTGTESPHKQFLKRYNNRLLLIGSELNKIATFRTSALFDYISVSGL